MCAVVRVINVDGASLKIWLAKTGWYIECSVFSDFKEPVVRILNKLRDDDHDYKDSTGHGHIQDILGLILTLRSEQIATSLKKKNGKMCSDRVCFDLCGWFAWEMLFKGMIPHVRTPSLLAKR